MSHRFIDMFAARADALASASAEHDRLAKRAAALDRTGSSEDNGCIFCDIVAKREAGFIVYESDHVLAFLDSASFYGFVPPICVLCGSQPACDAVRITTFARSDTRQSYRSTLGTRLSYRSGTTSARPTYPTRSPP